MKFKKLTIYISLVLLSAFGAYLLVENRWNCEVQRAAFDVGSGTIKIHIATVDRCSGQIKKSHLKMREKAYFKADLSLDKNFSSRTMASGLETLKRLRSEALKRGVHAKNMRGVATFAFRNSINSESFIREVHSTLGIKVTVIDQDEEAHLGFLGARDYSPFDPSEVTVWDIGGGSMSFVSLSEDGTPIISKGELASVALRDFIIRDLKKLDLKTHRTPNPIGEQYSKETIQVAFNHALQFTSEAIKKKLTLFPDKVVGIGGVHFHSVRNQLQLPPNISYSIEELPPLIQKRQELSDKDIGNEFSSTEVSNLLLVFGYMKALGIKSIVPAQIDLSDGLLINEKYW